MIALVLCRYWSGGYDCIGYCAGTGRVAMIALVLCRYWSGGYASGFTHVDHTVKPRLIHVKGKHCPRMREVCIAFFSANLCLHHC